MAGGPTHRGKILGGIGLGGKSIPAGISRVRACQVTGAILAFVGGSTGQGEEFRPFQGAVAFRVAGEDYDLEAFGNLLQ